MRACWADNATVPIACSIDLNERYNCRWAQEYAIKEECPNWNEPLAIKLAQDIIGKEYAINAVDASDINDELYRWGL